MVERKRKGEREREDYFVWKEGDIQVYTAEEFEELKAKGKFQSVFNVVDTNDTNDENDDEV